MILLRDVQASGFYDFYGPFSSALSVVEWVAFPTFNLD